MKKLACILLLIFICFYSLGVSAEEHRSEIAPLEASPYSGAIIELPENMLDSNTVKCFVWIDDETFFLSEANRFVIINTAGNVLYHEALEHPRLKNESSEIRGVGATENGLLFAVYDYQSDTSYLATIQYDDWDITYLPVMECCIYSANVTEDCMLIMGEIGTEKRSPWASMVTLDGTEMWHYVDTSLVKAKANITHRVETGVANKNVIYLLIYQVDKVEVGYSTQYILKRCHIDSNLVDSTFISNADAVNSVHQLMVDEEGVRLLCTTYDGEQNYPTILCVDQTSGEQELLPYLSATRVREVLSSGKNVILNAEYGDRTIIGIWGNTGEYLSGVEFPRETEGGRMTILRVLESKDGLWAAGVISKQKKDVRIRTTFFVPVK